MAALLCTRTACHVREPVKNTLRQMGRLGIEPEGKSLWNNVIYRVHPLNIADEITVTANKSSSGVTKSAVISAKADSQADSEDIKYLYNRWYFPSNR